MDTYLQSLRGTSAFMRASDEVTRADFDNYARHLQIDEFLPGVSAIGFIESVPHDELDGFLAKVREDGQPGFTLSRVADTQTHFIVRYIYPLGANREALGLDAAFEPVRAGVLRLARDTGEASMTPPIELVQHAKDQSGFLLLFPHFEKAVGPSATLPMGRGEFRGWVYAPFIASNLMADLTPSLQSSYSLQLFDGLGTDPEKLIFEDHRGEDAAGNYTEEYTIRQFGRLWTMVFTSTPRFDSAFDSQQPLIIGLSGILVTGLLLFLIRAISRRGEALRAVADLRTRQIEARNRENNAIVGNDVTAVFVLDSNENILISNRAAQTMLGYDEIGLSGLKFSSVIRELDAAAADQSFNAHGYSQAGQLCFLDLQRNEWTTADGESRVTAIVRDVTPQIEMQSELKRTKALYDMCLESARIGVFDLDLTTNEMKVAGTWLSNMGLSPDIVDVDVEEMLYARVHPDDLVVMRKIEQECMDGLRDQAVIDYRLRYSEDEWRWISSDALIVERNADGTAKRMIGIQWDVTELLHSRNALEVSEQRFRQVLAAAPVGMALTDIKGNFITVNEAFCKLCGIPEERIIAETRFSDIVPREDIKKVYKGATDMMNGPADRTYSAEHRIVHSSGEIRWGLFNISWTYDRNTEQDFFIAQINDITDQKRLSQAKNEFVATVSHELRTPLTSIKGALDLLTGSTNGTLPKTSQRLIEIARSNTSRLSRIVNDILDLEKISSGEVSFNFEAADLATMVQDAAEELAPFALTHANRLTLDLPADPLILRADVSRMKQVLANLISNACKYSSEDTEVLIKAERIGDSAIVYVQNWGAGVSESFKPKVFEAFSQADSSDTRANGGTGLGLNISKRIVTRHDGDMGFESKRNGITVFWFTCPLCSKHTGSVSGPNDASIVRLDSAKTGRISVLHVEKDDDFAEVIASALAPVAKFVHATSLAEAARISAATHLDAVILDCTLPSGELRAFLDRLALRQPGARVIGLSADETLTKDPRIQVNLVKGRSELGSIVSSVTQCLTRAS
ncbi:CHASE domain-containing protein [Roseovarius nanhaiticus]|nr:CHASE domain-containing protein [Roseovarius nanhaiticus]